MNETIARARVDFLQSKDDLVHALATTPDERLNWSPSPTSRTPIQQVAHAACAIGHLADTLDGRPFDVATMEEADRRFRAWEGTFRTREEVLALLEREACAFVRWLDALAPERLGTAVEMPFGVGSAPLSLAITLPAAHTRWHLAQLEYIQTIYGDRDWHADGLC